MKFNFGVDSFIWSENFTEKDLWVIGKAREIGFDYLDFAVAHPEVFPIEKVKAENARHNIIPILTTTLGADTNLVSPDPAIRKKGVQHMKLMVDICCALGAKILGGVNYAGWGCLTGKPPTREEFDWSVACMREVAGYAASKNGPLVAVEPVNRFETHFLNTAEQGVAYCKAVGLPNMKVHLDCFHMNIEETDFAKAVATCGKEFLGYVHVNESNRGIPGTGLVRWKEFFQALDKVGYYGPLTIESFDPNFEELSKNCAIWRRFTETGEELAIRGLANLKKIAATI